MSSAEDCESTIRGRPLPLGLPAGEFVAPHYDGLSIADIPATICALLGAGPLPTPPLALPLAGPVKRVVFVVVDALSYRRFQDFLSTDPGSAWQRLSRAGLFAPVTSVFPSTTAAALTTLWTGRTPQEHGMLGYELFLREFRLAARMLELCPSVHKQRDWLVSNGLLDLNTFLPVPGLAPHIAAAGVKTYALLPESIDDTGLSRMLTRGAEVLGFNGAADMWTVIRGLLEASADERCFVNGYWAAVDGIGHRRGPGARNLDAELRSLSYTFEREFLDELGPKARRDTMLILTADHGMTATPPPARVLLPEHPELLRRLVMLPTGESRAAYLYVRPGEVGAVRDYFSEHLGERFVVLDSAAALGAGLFGMNTPAAATTDRIGDLIAVARGPHCLEWVPDAKKPRMIGRHGGLSPDEMMVPFVAARLDEM